MGELGGVDFWMRGDAGGQNPMPEPVFFHQPTAYE